MRVIVYGGASEIGGNQILLERIFLDFGIPFSRRSLYFEEYLKPRAAKGILDVIEMGLIPPLSIYREDLFPPEFSKDMLSYEEIEGVLLSHSHLDHSGYISFLREDVPIYSSVETAIIAKAMQDTSPDFEKEVCYINRRDKKGDVLSSARESVARQFFTPQDFPESALSFWRDIPYRKGFKPKDIGKSTKIGSTNFIPIPVDHSVPGSLAFLIETEEGWVAYTGDIRFHGKNKDKSYKFVEMAKNLKPLLLITEGTNREGKPITEEEVFHNSLRVIKDEDSLVITDFGPRNVERLMLFLEIASITKRKLVILPKDAYLLYSLNLLSPEYPSPEHPDILIYRKAKVREEGWERTLEKFRSKEIGPREIRENEGDFILCFSFWDINELVSIKPRKGIYLYSSSEPHNEEERIDMERLKNWLYRFEIKGIGLSEEERFFHSSGHASREDIIWMIEEINPKYLMPIHTENPEDFLNLRNINVVIPRRGEPLEIRG